MTDPYQALANAIVEQAAIDYYYVLKYHIAHPHNRKLERIIKNIEQFFHSDWFEILTNSDGGYLLREIRRMVMSEERKKHLTAAGYDYSEVQRKVNKLMK